MKEKDKLIYDVYNERWKNNGITGTLTTHGNMSFAQCGTFLVIVENEGSEDKGFGNVGE